MVSSVFHSGMELADLRGSAHALRVFILASWAWAHSQEFVPRGHSTRRTSYTYTRWGGPGWRGSGDVACGVWNRR